MQQDYTTSRQMENWCLETGSAFPSSQANDKAVYLQLLLSTTCFLIIVLHS